MRRNSDTLKKQVEEDEEGYRVLIPLEDSQDIRKTIVFALENTLENISDEIKIYLDFIYIKDSNAPVKNKDSIMDRVETCFEEQTRDIKREFNVDKRTLEKPVDLSNPGNLIELLQKEVVKTDADRIILDETFEKKLQYPLILPLSEKISQYTGVQTKVVSARETRDSKFSLGNYNLVSFGAVFGVSFIFYMILSGGIKPFDVATGSLTALITAFALSKLIFTEAPGRETVNRVVRLFIYVPFLMWEIVKANIRVAALILKPGMPINPQFMWIKPGFEESVAITLLGNSITLTPGTLTVKVDDGLLIHAIDDQAREDLTAGDLQRWTEYVMEGGKK